MTRYRSLRARREFTAVLGAGKRTGVEGLDIVVAPGSPGVARLGLAVRASGAVRRNRIKRRLRHAFRAAGVADVDVVARADHRADDLTYQELVSAFRACASVVTV